MFAPHCSTTGATAPPVPFGAAAWSLKITKVCFAEILQLSFPVSPNLTDAFWHWCQSAYLTKSIVLGASRSFRHLRIKKS